MKSSRVVRCGVDGSAKELVVALDAQKLLTMLHREALGERDLWSVVHVPSVRDEDARSLQREYRTLVKERSRSSNRIKGLLASQGLVAPQPR